MRSITLFLLLLPIFSTAQDLEGTYPSSYEAKSSKSKAELWEHLADYLAKNSFKIQSMDKENGIAVVVSPDLSPKYSYEKNGTIQDPSAYVVMDKIRALDPKEIHLVMTIRVTDGKIICSTSSAEVSTDKSKKRSRWKFYPGAKSTGNYEKLIVEAVK